MSSDFKKNLNQNVSQKILSNFLIHLHHLKQSLGKVMFSQGSVCSQGAGYPGHWISHMVGYPQHPTPTPYGTLMPSPMIEMCNTSSRNQQTYSVS